MRNKLLLALALLLIAGNVYPWSETAEMDSKPGIGGWFWGMDYVTTPPSGSAIVVDATSPGTTSNVLQFNFPTGFPCSGDGDVPATYWNTFANQHGETNDLWVQFYVKYSTNYEWHNVGNKLIYVNTGEGFYYLFIMAVKGNLEFRTQSDMGNQNRGQNIGSTVTLTGGRWYKIKIHMVMNTVGQYNGIGEIWVDDVKIAYHSDIGYTSNGHGFSEVSMTPVNGGQDWGVLLTRDNYQWYDKFYIGNEEPGASPPPPPPPPPPPATGRKTRAEVLAYLTALKNKTSKKILSGQWTGFLNDFNGGGYAGKDSQGTDIIADIAADSGGYMPALMGADVNGTYTSHPLNLQRVIDYWNAGGIVELSFLPANPGNNNVWTWPISTPVIDIADVYTSGNSTYNNFRAQMDNVAGSLKLLQDNGVVVLFRPFLEANAGNPLWNPSYPALFWWGGKDYTKFHNLWIYFHDYFTNTKGLTNIIWVYAVNNWWRHELDYYPGNAYVDIVGYDYYPLGWDGNYDRFPYVAEYDTLQSTGKPFAFTELGQCPGDATFATCPSKDTRYIIQDIKANFPNAVYWMNWNDQWELGRHLYLPQLFADPWVVNLADNPSGSATPVGLRPNPPSMLMIQ